MKKEREELCVNLEKKRKEEREKIDVLIEDLEVSDDVEEEDIDNFEEFPRLSWESEICLYELDELKRQEMEEQQKKKNKVQKEEEERKKKKEDMKEEQKKKGRKSKGRTRKEKEGRRRKKNEGRRNKERTKEEGRKK
ncbi:hypothetical protein DPMN_100889 [Dreissena polymorpha]|uniref:Uncharacterized protein n=2 Tax=Dreissena polymorpha TaxID=45954 RepID=A0A9D4R8L6_DREPO|nr:hypothetical protein DPMN_100889 [Dreissena polymorpha]